MGRLAKVGPHNTMKDQEISTPPLGTSKINNYRVARPSVSRAEDATNNPATLVAFHHDLGYCERNAETHYGRTSTHHTRS
jgi:hypothetical protein